MVFLSPAEWWLIHDCLGEYWRPLTPTLVGTGMRWAWKEDENGRRYVGAPKSKKSKRTIGFDQALVSVLKPLVEGRHASLRTGTDTSRHRPWMTSLGRSTQLLYVLLPCRRGPETSRTSNRHRRLCPTSERRRGGSRTTNSALHWTSTLRSTDLGSETRQGGRAER
jgi:hypothetical protein